MRQPIGKIVAGPIDAGDRLPFFEPAIPLPPAAADIEVFERKPDRIEELVTGGTRCVFRVHREQVADRLRAADVGLDRRHALGRLRRRLAEQPRHHPRAAEHRRRVRAVGRHLLDRGLREESAERTAGRHGHLADGMTGERFETVMPRKPVVGKQELAVDDRGRRHVLADERCDEGAGLHAHALHQIVVETVFGIEADIGLVAAKIP